MDTVYVLLLAGAACLIGFVLLGSNNRLHKLNARCGKAEADIDVQLRHRHQLIPNLLELLKGYLANENKQLEMIGKLQLDAIAASGTAQRLQAEEMLGNRINQLVMSAAQLPQLNSNTQFSALRNELADADNKISAARRFFNLAIEEYNASLNTFPSAQFAKLHGLQERRFFSLGLDRPLVEEAPVIKF